MIASSRDLLIVLAAGEVLLRSFFLSQKPLPDTQWSLIVLGS